LDTASWAAPLMGARRASSAIGRWVVSLPPATETMPAGLTLRRCSREASKVGSWPGRSTRSPAKEHSTRSRRTRSLGRKRDAASRR
jgi:hypothetical protein